MNKLPRPKACGHKDCCASSGYFNDEITFGRGELDDYGYWEIPCYPCAKRWKDENPLDNVWPQTPLAK